METATALATLVLVVVAILQLVLKYLDAKEAARRLEHSARPLIGELQRRLKKAAEHSASAQFSRQTYQRWTDHYLAMISRLSEFNYASLKYSVHLQIVRERLWDVRSLLKRDGWKHADLVWHFLVAVQALSEADAEIKRCAGVPHRSGSPLKNGETFSDCVDRATTRLETATRAAMEKRQQGELA